jgi:hypothetical protein
MNDISEQRPDFFEGEILSAADLEQLVVYLRDQSARHALGGHTWGIVAGLQLLEQTISGNSVDVYLLPGYAVDGYGRAIVVVNPLRLSVDWFNGQPSGPVQVWIRYDQGQTSAVRPGFQVCCNGGDNYSRVAESYSIEVGNLSLPSQQTGISVSGENVDDARTVPRLFNDAGPIICDGSVPFQDLPLGDDTASRWLIPLGQVGWQAGTPGQFLTLTDPNDPTKVIFSRRLRRYVGLVGENFYAADGLIRLRRRTSEVAGIVDQKLINATCAAGSLTDPSHDQDLENCAEGPTPSELVWVEGRLRVTGDTRILDGRMELRDAAGTNYYPPNVLGSAPTFLQRTDRKLNADLQIVIGKAASDNNRLLIQQAADPQQPQPCQSVQFSTLNTLVSVLDDGKVGIGTDSPKQLLDLAGPAPAFVHIKDTTDATDLYVGADQPGGILATTKAGELRFRTGGTDPADDNATRMTIVAAGQVGIGTTSPDGNAQLTLQAKTQSSLIVRTDDDKHEALLRANGEGALVAANIVGDDLILGANGQKKVWIKASGRVGVNTNNPGSDLTVAGSANSVLALQTSSGTIVQLAAGANGNSVGTFTSEDFGIITDDTTRIAVTQNGQVGIGTQSPGGALDVRGNIRLGNSGQYSAPGAYGPSDIVSGLVDKSGVGVGPNHSASRISQGVYDVKFTHPFSGTPAVSITLQGTPASSNPTPIIDPFDGTHFTVTMSLGGSHTLDFSFCFIAIGGRA